ncbi:sigma-70 family RNA polymerase sigma factor [uncultured Zhongshania sp.]|jgi:RNA polymerase sigma-70 factor (ECF subfamily)|uniref:sigma-70 family RNA polymerase sigma factor n=1 Tax=uncultured Zhongshania sp. TaxID=1642288 RepID=UPI0025CD1D6B|nr:sigma-70 family RNA polymerase sigma factor [uncultured Zhongshania sp.]
MPVSVPADDQELIRRLKTGDNNAFKQLIGSYHPKLLIVARAIVGDVFAEDVTQEAWSSIYKAIAKFEGRSSLSTWMIQIVSNEAKSRLRREKRHSSFGDIDEVRPELDANSFNGGGHWANPPSHWDINTPELMLQEDQLRHCIEHTLTILPENQKAVFLLRDVEQHSLEEIAELLSLSEANVRVILHRARLQLMKTINHYQETGEC